MSAKASNPTLAVPEDEIEGIATRSSRANRLRLARIGVVSVGAIALVVLAVLTSGFLTIDNAKAILASAAIVGILAVGETVIMISGNLFSLSLATTAAIAALGFVYALQFGLPLAIVFAILLGALASGLQGVLIGRWRANPIIVTIAAGSLQEGIGSWLTGNHELLPPASQTSYTKLGNPIAGIPLAVYVFIGLAIAIELLLRRTRFGVLLYLMGDNRQAARAAALPVARIATYAFLIAGVMAGIAGILLAAEDRYASFGLEGTYTYYAIAAALVGGTAVGGGRGTMGRTVIGTLIIAAVSDIALLRGYNTGVQVLVQGVLVLIAVIMVRLIGRGDQ